MSPTDTTGSDPLAPPVAASGELLLRVEGLTKSFGANQVLKGVDFEVRRGEVVVPHRPERIGQDDRPADA